MNGTGTWPIGRPTRWFVVYEANGTTVVGQRRDIVDAQALAAEGVGRLIREGHGTLCDPSGSPTLELRR